MSQATDIEELQRLADQCICHPVSRSIGEVEQAGEAIKSLIAQLEAAKAELQALRALEPAMMVHKGEVCYKSKEDDQSFGMWCPVSYEYQSGFPEGTRFCALPEQKK